MDTLEVVRSETESAEDIRAMLEGQVFHVTKLANWQTIQASGHLLPNESGRLPTTFGFSSNSFFRLRGCVSLFDYRATPTEEVVDYRCRCDPLQPAKPGGEAIAILFLDSSIHERLIPWTRWKDEQAFREMVVPHVEAGHQGAIPLEAVQRVILFRRIEDSESFAAQVRRAHAAADRAET